MKKISRKILGITITIIGVLLVLFLGLYVFGLYGFVGGDIVELLGLIMTFIGIKLATGTDGK